MSEQEDHEPGDRKREDRRFPGNATILAVAALLTAAASVAGVVWTVMASVTGACQGSPV
ncbi:hypothetical protein [Actinoplanes regularis]|uniref:hypothetical protein n=1 Tax=Actinoplanes regularis TaxID=52697 RepID=UPI00255648F2|nr:hypothetical protein [Actinoplanes regularis]